MSRYPKTVEELIEFLETQPADRMIRAGLYDTWSGSWKLSYVTMDTLFTDEEGSKDLTDRERDRDIETLIFY